MNDIAIQLTHVTKKYTIHHEKPTLVEKFIKKNDEEFIALNDITLTIKKGEKIGIIGPNGSGKTTLLKVIAGITSPTTGNIYTKGETVSLIDLEAGFHPDLTGYQNIFLNGIIIGMNKNKLTKKIHHIISFADIGTFIDIPMYTYSSGMKLRLGYAIAIQSNPDVLILDESLQVGDTNFQKKCKKSLQSMMKKNTTLIVASHDLSFIKRTCKTIIVMKQGKIIEQGNNHILSKYI